MSYCKYSNKRFYLIILFYFIILSTLMAQDNKIDNIFTSEELSYISQSQQFSVGLKPDRFIMSYYDEETGFGGLNYEIMEEISRISGLNFVYVPLVSGKTRTSSIIEGDYDFAIAFFDYEKSLSSNEILFSNSFMENSFEIIMKNPDLFSFDKPFSIAVPKSANTLQAFIKKNYPLAEIVYTPADERAEAVLKNKVDSTIIGRLEANYILQMPRYRSLLTYPTNIVLGDNSIAMSSKQDPILVTILNKSIDYMMENSFSRILTESTIMKRYEYTFKDLIIGQIEKILIIIVIIFSLFLLFLRLKNKKIQKLKISAENANKAKTDFISRMSHDMRTPLGAVINLSEFGIIETNDSIKTKYFKKIKNSSEYLLELVNDILDINLIEKGKIPINEKPIIFHTLIDSIRDIIQVKADEKNILLTINILNELSNKTLFLDMVQSKKILINILANAVNFTPNGGSVTLNVIKSDENHSSVTIKYEIIDTGIGISEEFQKKMYNPFEIEQSTNQKTSMGTGLGLSITKYLVNKMGGKIDCNSKKDQGTIFTIEITYKKGSKAIFPFEKDTKININIQPLLKNKLILICEDNKINQMIIKKILVDQGCKVDIADNGEIGLNMAKITNYDIIIMDIRMPVMDGYTASKKIKEFNKDIPIIGLSADVSAYDYTKADLSSLDAYISKPINTNLFFTTICKFISS